MTRPCNGCTACCEGWLSGTANGHGFFPSTPCHYMKESSCAIYPDHPENPCKTFRCLWSSDSEFLPEWLKPSRCKVIPVIRKQGEMNYLSLHEMGGKIDAAVLSWYFIQHKLGKIENLKWTVQGGAQWVGSTEFIESITGKTKTNE